MNPEQSYRGWIIFSRPNVNPDFELLFEKLTAQIGEWNLKAPSVRYASETENFM